MLLDESFDEILLLRWKPETDVTKGESRFKVLEAGRKLAAAAFLFIRIERDAVPVMRPSNGHNRLLLPSVTCAKLARQKGFEPLTYGLEGRCSIQLSYWRN